MTITLIKKFAFALSIAALFCFSSITRAADLPEDGKVGGFVVSGNCYTFNKFTLFESIEKTAQLGLKTIEMHPGQKLSPEEPNVTWDHNSPEEVRQKVRAQLAKYHIQAVDYSVVYVKGGEAEWRKVFEFAKAMGLWGITTESVGDMDTIEKMVKEYDIHVSIHEHQHRPDHPEYKLWDPNYVLSLVKDRDPRIGACGDTGHWATSGLKPVDCLKILQGRVMSLHLKERKVLGKASGDVLFGTGACDIKGILDELKRQGFQGHISLEYENFSDHLVADEAQNVGYIRGCSACGQ